MGGVEPAGSARSTAEGSGSKASPPPALLPALLVFAFAVELGTFYGAAGGVQALVGHGALWLLAVHTLPKVSVRSLGPPILAWAALAVSVALSPVPRAGATALAVSPFFWLIPTWTASLWADPAARRLGLRGLAWCLGAVAGGALVAWRVYDTPGTSLPLGHHNLLASWLVALLPLALLRRQVGAVTAGVAGALGVAALAATGSLAGAVGLAAAGAVWMVGEAFRGDGERRTGRRRRWLGGLALAAVAASTLALGSDRVRAVLAGDDLSLRARWGYMEAAFRGVLERPAFGWGAGSARWTLAEHLRPTPGVHPPGEVVAHVHSLPLQTLYELGAVGVVLLAVAFLWALRLLTPRLRRERGGAPPAESRAIRRAAGLGLLGLGVSSLGGLDLSVTAVPAAAAVLCGVIASTSRRRRSPGRRVGRVAGWTAAALLVFWQLPRDLAHIDYDRARRAALPGDGPADPEGAIRHLASARARDPGYPLYGARADGFADEEPSVFRRVPGTVGGDARPAAEVAYGVAALWLRAGERALAAGEPAAARRAYLRACDLDRLGAVAPFRLAALDPLDPAAPSFAGRALVAEPRLLASTGWPPGLVDAAVGAVLGVDGLDPGWRLALDEASRRVARRRTAGDFEPSPARLGLRMDRTDGESVSLFTFRRRPWPMRLATLELERGLLPAIDLPSAARLELTDRSIFTEGCRLGPGADGVPEPTGPRAESGDGRRR
ncbi:MAG: O-antigen ligase family protein [Acidobacteriota bacterium]